jgi:hypothetical protein
MYIQGKQGLIPAHHRADTITRQEAQPTEHPEEHSGRERKEAMHDASHHHLGKQIGRRLQGKLFGRCRCGSRPCTCSRLPDSMNRGAQSAPGNQLTLYQPGWYIRGS